MDESGIRHDPSRVCMLLGLIIQVLIFSLVFPCWVFANFLYLLRVRNSGNVVLILDNAKFHKSSYVFATASRLNITLLFLPPYSPDLNPIELVWKDLKRWVNTYYYSCYALELRMSSIIWFLRVIILGIGLISFVTCLGILRKV